MASKLEICCDLGSQDETSSSLLNDYEELRRHKSGWLAAFILTTGERSKCAESSRRETLTDALCA
jgi:hypothetical protein